MLCPKCKVENPDEAKFCISCGNPLVEPTPTQATPEPAPTPKKKSNTCLYVALGVAGLFLLTGIVGFFAVRSFIKESGFLEEIKKAQESAYTSETETTTTPEEKPSPFGEMKEEEEEEEPTPRPTEEPVEPIRTVDCHFPVGAPYPHYHEDSSSPVRYPKYGSFTASLLSVENTPGALHVRYRIECKGGEVSNSLGTGCAPKLDKSSETRCCQVPSFQYDGKWSNEYNPAIGGYALDEDTGKKHLVQTRSAEGTIKGSQIASGAIIKEGESKSMWIEFEPLPQTTKTVTIKLGYIDAFEMVSVEQY